MNFSLKKALTFSIITALFSISSHASEGDAFKARMFQYKEVMHEFDDAVNARLQMALDKVNKKNVKNSVLSCEKDELLDVVGKKFRRPVVGIFEFWAVHSSDIPGHYIPLKKSIYQDLTLKENLPVHTGKLGMATFYLINDVLVASDKFGHFFDEGWTYYKIIKAGGSLTDAMNKGIELESGIYGLERSQVFSYGDLAANRAGLEFWKKIADDREDSYLKCEKGQWSIKNRFSFKPYVNAAWDEGINCSRYTNESITKRVNKRIQEFQTQSGLNLTCPTESDKCSELKQLYGDEAKYILNPLCLNAN